MFGHNHADGLYSTVDLPQMLTELFTPNPEAYQNNRHPLNVFSAYPMGLKPNNINVVEMRREKCLAMDDRTVSASIWRL